MKAWHHRPLGDNVLARRQLGKRDVGRVYVEIIVNVLVVANVALEVDL